MASSGPHEASSHGENSPNLSTVREEQRLPQCGLKGAAPNMGGHTRGASKRCLGAAIRRLSQEGLYGIPLEIQLEGGKKKTIFQQSYEHIKSVDIWKECIDDMLKNAADSVNSIAVLTGISDVFALDIDKEGKASTGVQSGSELWKDLIVQHGEPRTLKANTARGGIHYLFRSSLSTRFEYRNSNFATLQYNGKTWAIDGRGGMGLIFVDPSTFRDEQGTIYKYTWDRSHCTVPQAMPEWVIDLLNDANKATSTSDPVAAGSQCSKPKLQVVGGTIPNGRGSFPGLQAAVEKIAKCLQDKLPGDKSRFRRMNKKTPNGWHILKYKTVGTRICLNGERHDSNNFSILSNGALLLYRCLSPKCIQKLKCLLGVHFWPECLPERLGNGEVLHACEKYICGQMDSGSKEDQKAKTKTLAEITMAVLNTYCGVVVGVSKPIYIETVFQRSIDGSLKPNGTILRTGADFALRCETLHLQHLPAATAGQFWRQSPDRKIFDSIVFDPNLHGSPTRDYNLYNGLCFDLNEVAVLDADGLRDCEARLPRLFWHIRHILGNGDDACFQYILNWLAHQVQRPGKKIGVALVFKSKQGAGKGLIWDFVGFKIIGKDLYLYCNDLDKVISKFNSISANKLLTIFDEVSSWGGAYKSNNRLKSHITQECNMLEKKGIDPIQVKDFCNSVFTTNEEWPIKREVDDRRYAAIEASNEMLGNTGYFNRLSEELEKVETAKSFFQYLRSLDISCWNAKMVPHTSWGESLRAHSIPAYAAMVQALLENGCFHPWRETWAASEDISATYETFLRDNHIQAVEAKLTRTALCGALHKTFKLRSGTRNLKRPDNGPFDQGAKTIRGWWFMPEGDICKLLRSERMFQEGNVHFWKETRWERPLGHANDDEYPWMTSSDPSVEKAKQIEEHRTCPGCKVLHIGTMVEAS